jgi:diguanylate cyclase (GGDEF)-like protein
MKLQTQIAVPLLFLGLGALAIWCAFSVWLYATGNVALFTESVPETNSGERRISPAPLLLVGAALLCVFILALVFTLSVGRAIAAVLRQIPRDFRKLAQDLEAVPFAGRERRDEIGLLSRSLERHARQMGDTLSDHAQVEKLALTDVLTGLPNRRGLDAFFEELSAKGALGKLDQRVGVVHIDLDHFKAINDTLGHEAGDFVLREATRRMKSTTRDTDLLARIGGDEFVVIVPHVEERRVLESLSDRILSALSEPIPFGEEFCHTGASIGMSLSSGAKTEQETEKLLRDADAALAEAKSSGRNKSVFFTDAMAKRLREKQEKAREIREALLDGEFMPWFQPMIDLETGETTGIELLTRWHHPQRGLLPPSEFLDAAETHNLIEEIGLEVLERACHVIADMRVAGISVPRFHVNMTRKQLLAPAVIDRLSWILDDANIPLEQVAIEISEKICKGRNAELMFKNARRLAALGMSPVLDDFGVEGGAVDNLSHISARQLKCARSVTAALLDPKLRSWAELMLRSIRGFVTSLEISAVAKGVESQEQVQVLSDLGITHLQGDALAPTMDATALRAWLSTQRQDQIRQATTRAI